MSQASIAARNARSAATDAAICGSPSIDSPGPTPIASSTTVATKTCPITTSPMANTAIACQKPQTTGSNPRGAVAVVSGRGGGAGSSVVTRAPRDPG